MSDAAFLTERQEKWFAAVQDGLERETGHALTTWIEIAQTCPEAIHRKRLAWMKAQHGLGQNRASIVLQAAFPPDAGWARPELLADTLWGDPGARAIYEALHAAIMRLPDLVVGQRKAYTAYSRNFQFCAIRPVRSGAVMGLALHFGADPALLPPMRQPWSERLLSAMPLASVKALPRDIGDLLQAAWEKS